MCVRVLRCRWEFLAGILHIIAWTSSLLQLHLLSSFLTKNHDPPTILLTALVGCPKHRRSLVALYILYYITYLTYLSLFYFYNTSPLSRISVLQMFTQGMEQSRETLSEHLTGLKSLLRLNADGVGDNDDLTIQLNRYLFPFSSLFVEVRELSLVQTGRG